MNRHYWETAYEDLLNKQEQCIQKQRSRQEQLQCCFNESLQATNEITKKATQASYKDRSDQIYFLKIVKPKFVSHLIRLGFMYHAMEFEPNKDLASQVEFWLREKQRLIKYIKSNSDFYNYWKAERTDKDDEYFVWTKQEEALTPTGVHNILNEMNEKCDTHYSNQVAYILALEKYTEFVNGRLGELSQFSGKN